MFIDSLEVKDGDYRVAHRHFVTVQQVINPSGYNRNCAAAKLSLLF